MREKHKCNERTIWTTGTTKELQSKAVIIALVISNLLKGEHTTVVRSMLPLGTPFIVGARKKLVVFTGHKIEFSSRGAEFQLLMVYRVLHVIRLNGRVMMMFVPLI